MTGNANYETKFSAGYFNDSGTTTCTLTVLTSGVR